ncbi:Crp/Fnr family transcriptional regulator [Nitrosovibrio sp. Nv6]|uniref:Crp/Fnr family transcriptional regulator n=1 Tax=Nitrosovibrio sp. Nv6 TaxID=1855340 RepID=UPI0008D1B6C1|nr:Crp/Fnr family transcriptional regulator [Nitrosovibrio sp. Nv6]SEP20784.1 cAMP-binding domain of CRP or a regulatory subunit of cAMP-dependent protein kinases [Nitrosovibrio sp. Nv6]
MFPQHSPKQNKILAALPAEDYGRLFAYLEFISLPLGQIIHEPGSSITHAYFPTTSTVAPLYGVENGASVQLSIIGNEGLTGISSLLGSGSTPTGVVVQSAGDGYRIKTSTLKKEFDSRGKLQHLVLRFTQALMTQTAQNAVCNRHHNIEQQLGRFLLMSLDRLAGHDLQMTHEQIAIMLGVRRESVTQAALKLQMIGAIQYSRGHITVMDREELENSVCECYAVVNNEYDRLLSNYSASHPAQSPAKLNADEELWSVN